MWTYYLHAMLELNENIQTLPILKRSVLGCAFKAAYDSKKISETHCIQYIGIMYATGAADNLILNIIDGSLAMHPMSAVLWESKMKFYIQCKDDQKVAQVFGKAKQKLGKDAHPIWSLYMKYLFTLEKGSQKMKAFFQDIITQPHENFRFLKADCIENSAALFGINDARKFFNDAFRNGFPCLEMYNKMVEIEELQVKKRDSLTLDKPFANNFLFSYPTQVEPDVKNWRNCMTLGSYKYGQDNIDVWLNFIKFELKHGDPKDASRISERAIGALKTELVDSFVFNRDALQLGIVAP